MARQVFYSFHFKPDNYRVSQVTQIGAIQGQRILSSNKWEEVQRKGSLAIKRWINQQMVGKSCVIVLAGRRTANRKWVNYEIIKGWNDGKGVLVVHIHKLKNSRGEQATKGANPLASVDVGGVPMSSIAKAYNPRGGTLSRQGAGRAPAPGPRRVCDRAASALICGVEPGACTPLRQLQR